MKSKLLFAAIGNIDDRFIIEDAETPAIFRGAKVVRFSTILKFVAPVAACLVIAIAIFGLPKLPTNSPSLLVTPTDSSPSPYATEASTEPSAPVVSENTIVIHGLTDGQHSPKVLLGENGEYGELNFLAMDTLPDIAVAPPYVDPATTYTKTWSLEQVNDYLGRDFRPGYVPNDLIEYADPYWTVIFNKDGTMIPFSSSFTLTYSENFNEEYDPLKRSLYIQVAKDSLPQQCSLYLTDTEAPSNIDGTDIVVGYCKMSYGPYTVTAPGETSITAGYYDLYIAEFVYDGIGYCVRSENLTQKEFIEVLLSIVK